MYVKIKKARVSVTMSGIGTTQEDLTVKLVGKARTRDLRGPD